MTKRSHPPIIKIDRDRAYKYIILLALIAFEIFSYSSGREGLRLWLGDEGRPISWINLLSFSFCAVDIAAAPLLKIVRETKAFYIFLILWILSAIGDTFFTWAIIAYNAVTLPLPVIVQAGIISISTWLHTIPLLFAVLTWLIQYLLVMRAEHAAGELLSA